MNTYISLLRGINVGGSKILSMDALCEIYASLGFSRLRTYLQSGNVIFNSPQPGQSAMASQIESRIEQVCSFHVEVFIRQPHDFQAIIANNPFVHQAQVDAARLHVSFLYRAPAAGAWDKLVIRGDVPDKFFRGDMVLYLYYPNGFAKAKITTSSLEKALGVPLTNRNWNTVTALYKMSLE